MAAAAAAALTLKQSSFVMHQLGIIDPAIRDYRSEKTDGHDLRRPDEIDCFERYSCLEKQVPPPRSTAFPR